MKKINLLLLIVLCGITNCFSQIEANFFVNPSTGCAVPHTVFFTDQSTLPDTWFWDFGDGNTSTLQNPVHNYVTGGDFTVTLTVVDTIFGTSDQHSSEVNVNIPNAQIGGGSGYFGCGPLTVNFVESSMTNGGSIVSWLWSFGDGHTSSEQTPTHTYINPGIYNVSLAITTTAGCTNTDVKNNFVQVIGPDVNFDPKDTLIYSDGTTSIDFSDATMFGAPIISWNWNFEDGGSSSLQNPTHSYTNQGHYDVGLTVQDIDGCSRSRNENLIVVDTTKQMAIEELEICEGESTVLKFPTIEGMSYTILLNGNPIDTIFYGTGDSLIYNTGSLNSTSNYQIQMQANNNFSGKSIYFDGVNDYISVPHQSDLNLTSSFTISTWFKSGNTGQSQKYLLNKENRYALIYNYKQDSVEFYSGFYTGDDPRIGTSMYVDDQWHYITYTYDGNVLKGYIDGELKVNEEKSFVLATTNENLLLGTAETGIGFVEGNLDETSIWNTAITHDEITSNQHRCLDGNEPSLVSFYGFDQGVNSQIIDGSALANNGILVNTNIGASRSPGYGCFQDDYTYIFPDSKTVSVNIPTSSTITDTVCESVSFNSIVYNSSGIYTQVLTNSKGCDSTITYDLTVFYVDSTVQNEIACDTFMWIDGNNYSKDTNGVYFTVNGEHCDSVVELNLQFDGLHSIISMLNDTTLTAENAADSYQWYNCSTSSIINDETNQNFQPSSSGEYALIISNTNCYDTSECISYSHLNIKENAMDLIKVFPNPFKNEIEVIGYNGNIKILDVNGKVLFTTSNQINTKIDLSNLSLGIYFIQFGDDSIQKLIKN